MTVRDILEVANENTIIKVWKNGKVISVADGKDTIDEKYLDDPVKEIRAAYFQISIDI